MRDERDKLIDDYLGELRRELADLPRSTRREVVQEISEHVVEARAALEHEDEAAVRDLLDRLGDPADIAAEARERFGIRPRKRGWVEILALILLPLGGIIIPVVGWIIGVMLLWLSSAWTKRDKILGTLIVPGGLLIPLYLLMAAGPSEHCIGTFDSNGRPIVQTCSGGPSDFARVAWPTGVGLMVLATFAMTVYLARRSGRSGTAAVA